MLPTQAAKYLLARLDVKQIPLIAPARVPNASNFLDGLRLEVAAQVSLQLQEALGNTRQGIPCNVVMPHGVTRACFSFTFPGQLDAETSHS